MYKLQNGFTKEKMIEKIVKYNNGTKCMDDEGHCSYDTGNNRCSVGCFIPDGHKALHEDDASATGLFETYPDLIKLMPLNDQAMDKFQGVHDSYKTDSFLTLHEELIKWINENVES